ncbi:hypothetical protein Bca101_017204 [Brassica carinata]
MAPTERKQKLSLSETVSPSLSKIKRKKNKKKKVSKSLITTSTSHSEKDSVTVSPSPISKVNVEKAMKKQNDVAMFLAEKVISAVAENSNFVFSPASINVALTMLASVPIEETLRSSTLSFLRSYSMDELKAVFSEIAAIVLADGSGSGGPKISNVNGAEEVREEVNAWASKHTNVSVPFMTNHKKQYVEQYKGFKVLKLPFRQSGDTNRQFSMYFYLPDAKDGLNSLVKRVASSSSTLGFLDSHTPRKQVEVGLFRIPKFKIDFGFEASSAFKGLNMPSLSLRHKALVEIDEDGAEAAAVTVIMGRGGRGFSSGRRIDFVTDHPFLFMIREDKTGTVLFVGQIFDPSKSA